jgi:hypothetical protein
VTERSLSAGFQANIAGRRVELFVLIEMILDSGTIRMTSTPFDVSYGGFNWLTTHGLGSIESIKENGSEITGLSFVLSAVPVAMLSIVLNERLFKKPVRVLVGTVNAGVLAVDDNAWSGLLDTSQINVNQDTFDVRVAAEHRMITWQNVQPVNMSDAEQRLVSSTDTFFSRAAKLTNKPIIWPKKEFFER